MTISPRSARQARPSRLEAQRTAEPDTLHLAREALAATPDLRTSLYLRQLPPRPASRTPDETPGVAETPGLAVAPERGTILVVDDYEPNRTALARHLTLQGHTVVMAEGGHQALDLLRHQPFDLVLLDLMLPDLDGDQVLLHIRSDVTLRHVPVVIVSAVEDMASVVRCVELGAADYLFKPCDPVLLRARVSTCLEKKRLRDLEQTYLEQIRAEQEQADRLLLNVLPVPIAKRLKRNPGIIAESYDEITVLFADLVGFTELAARISPTRLVGILNEMFSRFDRLAAIYGIEKIKTIGDAYMVVGGAPRRRPDHAEAVAYMALSMRQAVAEFSAQQGEPLAVRMGINTGPAVAGVIGAARFSYDLWGDAVNIASRMETLGLPGGIQVSAATAERLRGAFALEPRGTVWVKGKGNMETYWLGEG